MCTSNLWDLHARFTRCAHSWDSQCHVHEMCTLNSWDFHAMFADFGEKTEKSSNKERKKKKYRGRDIEIRTTDTDKSWGHMAGVWIPITHINVIWVWQSACNPNIWEQRQNLTSWLARLAKSSSSRVRKKPWSVSKADSLSGKTPVNSFSA